VVLFAACPPPEALKFEPATGHWRKRVSRSQVQALYEARPVGVFRGEPCIVLDDLSDRLHIVYLGHDALRAAQLGYWEVDRGVFELITPRHEVTDIVEQRRSLPIGGDTGQHTWPGLTRSGRPDDNGSASGNGVPYDGFEQRASRDGLPASQSQELPIAGLGRPELKAARAVDPSEVAIPSIPEPPLPLEAEALRAASSAARRGQKNTPSRLAQDASAAGRTQPSVEVQAQAGSSQTQKPRVAQPAATQPVAAQPVAAQPAATQPVAAQPVAAQPVAAEPVVTEPVAAHPVVAPVPPAPPAAETPVSVQTVKGTSAPAEAMTAPAKPAEVSQPLPGPLPAAAMLSQAAMLSHAAATAARLAPASSKPSKRPASPAAVSGEPSAPSEQESPAQESVPRTGMATEAAVAPPPASEHVDAPTAAEAATPAPSGQERPTTPESAEPAPIAPDHAEEATSTPLVGISDPPSVAHPAAAAVPSWLPQGPVQPQTGFEAVPPAQPTHDIAAGQDRYYAPYVTTEPAPPNGTATANGTAAPVDLGLTAPTLEPAGFPPPTFMAQPEPLLPSNEMPAPAARADADQVATTRRRRGTKRRLPTQKIFSDLTTQAAIPAAAYAIGEDVDGAMCLMRTDEGYEVFNSAGGARHEVRVFGDEESAYFYLFGVLVAESVRTGALVPRD